MLTVLITLFLYVTRAWIKVRTDCRGATFLSIHLISFQCVNVHHSLTELLTRRRHLVMIIAFLSKQSHIMTL